MCCRCFVKPKGELRSYIEEAGRSLLAAHIAEKTGATLLIEGEARPTDLLPVIAPDKRGKQAIFPMFWGFRLPRSSSPIVNARVETVREKQLFCQSWAHRRCVIPASCYFEWAHFRDALTGKTKTGDKYRIAPRGADMTMLAGVYRTEERNGLTVPVFTILTRAPGEEIGFIHDRMPVILPEDAVGDWIRPDADPAPLLSLALTDMVFEKCGEENEKAI